MLPEVNMSRVAQRASLPARLTAFGLLLLSYRIHLRARVILAAGLKK